MEHPFRILLVEDMQRYHKLFADEILKAMPATVDFCESGEEALQILEPEPKKYDLLLLDLNLPGLSGHDVLKRLRGNPDFDGLPVIILTSHSNQALQSQLFADGADEFIEKDSAPEVFIARLKAQAKHKLALDRLTELAADREDFAAGVLHDIRNIEMNLLAACELIEMQIKSDPQKNKEQILADLASFKEQIKRIDSYATSILQKVRGGGNRLLLERLRWQDTLRWARDFVSGNQPTLEIELKDEEHWSDVQGDKHLLRLAVLNIVQNAVKYSQTGQKPKIVVSQSQSESGRIISKLRDFGIGVPKSELRRIFEPFYRAHSEKSAESHGLGLSMVANVVRKMNGRVWAEAPEDGGPGTIFAVELPQGES